MSGVLLVLMSVLSVTYDFYSTFITGVFFYFQVNLRINPSYFLLLSSGHKTALYNIFVGIMCYLTWVALRDLHAILGMSMHISNSNFLKYTTGSFCILGVITIRVEL